MTPAPQAQAAGCFEGATASPEVLGDDAPATPWPLARAWLPGNDERERPVITLATVDADGWPNARSVLLSAFDEQGLHIHTDGRSTKAAELEAVPRAAIVLRWGDLARQLVVRGPVSRDDPERCARAFARRDPYLRTLAYVSTLEHAQLSCQERTRRWAAAQAGGASPAGAGGRAEQPVPPSTWVGFVLRPNVMTFWAGSTTMASRRVEYRRDDDGWARRFLPG